MHVEPLPFAMDSTSQSLWHQIKATTEQALHSGALQPISTQLHILPDQSLQFCVRVIDSLARKEAAKKYSVAGTRQPNPFLPYEQALWVTHLSDTHVCLLNKFNVVDHHILIVTREYESQDTWLTLADFEALAGCLLEIEGLGFYNGGTQAGASQHHKHLQLIPFVHPQEAPHLPLSAWVDAQNHQLQTSHHLAGLPFHHSIRLFSQTWNPSSHLSITGSLLKTYQQLMTDIGLDLETPKPTVPYNLLVTRQWMMAIPRSQESYAGIGVNSLGYSGWLLVKTTSDLQRLQQIGPMNLLTRVGTPG